MGDHRSGHTVLPAFHVCAVGRSSGGSGWQPPWRASLQLYIMCIIGDSSTTRPDAGHRLHDHAEAPLGSQWSACTSRAPTSCMAVSRRGVGCGSARRQLSITTSVCLTLRRPARPPPVRRVGDCLIEPQAGSTTVGTNPKNGPRGRFSSASPCRRDNEPHSHPRTLRHCDVTTSSDGDPAGRTCSRAR